MDARDHGRRVGAVAVGQVGAQPLDHLQRLRLPSLRGKHPDEQGGGRLVRRCPRDESAQVDLVERAHAGECRLRAQRGDLREQAGVLGADQLRHLGEQRPRLIGQTAGGTDVTAPEHGARLIDERARLDRVDGDLLGGQPVSARHRDHGQPETAYPGHERLDGAGRVVGWGPVPDGVHEQVHGDRAPPRVDERAEHRREPFTPNGLAVDGEWAEGRDLHGPSIPHARTDPTTTGPPGRSRPRDRLDTASFG
ncbi:hypothetical protein ONO86_04674 [Micromonospora noduli]|nr:hypothetical protein ONO86_04674 [Micromonospora noduli]